MTTWPGVAVVVVVLSGCSAGETKFWMMPGPTPAPVAANTLGE